MARPRLLLLFPPQAPAVFPPLNLPLLVAAARAAGLETLQADLNLLFYRRILDRAFQAETLTRVTAAARARPDGPEGFRLSLLAGLGGSAVAALPEALKTLTDPEEFYVFPRYAAAVHDLRTAMRLVGGRYGAQEIGLDGGVLRYSERSSAEIVQALEDREGNPYLDLLAEPVVDLLEATRPGYVGLSVTYAAQLIPAFSLARLIRNVRPECAIILGGNTVTHLGRRLAASPLFSLADALVLGEGEAVLPALVWSLSRGEDVSHLPGVLAQGKTCGAAGTVGAGEGPPGAPPEVIPDLSSLPGPCFDGLDLRGYLSPEPILPMQLSRGCYWGRCAFCNYNLVYGSGYRTLRPERAVGIIRDLARTHGARAFVMTDSVVSPSLLDRMAQAIREAGLDIVWDASVRIEPALADPRALADLARAGCRLLHFGLESAVPRVLDLMRKGTDAALAGRFIEAANGAGLWTKALLFFGFPGETEAEARRTMAFVDERRGMLQAVAPGVEFTVTPGSPVMLDPAGFGVSHIDIDPAHDLALAYAHENARGLPRAQVTALAAEFTRWVKAQALSPESTLFYPILGGHDLLYAARGGAAGARGLKEGEAARQRMEVDGSDRVVCSGN